MPTTTKKKKELIVVGVNSLVSTTQAAYANHCQMWYRLGRYYTNFDFIFVNPPRMSIDRMRNLAADVALSQQAKYLLFIDDDVIVPSPFDFLEKLLKLNVDVAAADVIIRGYPFNHMLFRYNKDKSGLIPVAKLPVKRGPYPCDAVGFSVCLIKTNLLQRLSRPYFITGVNNTEDIYFCVKARAERPATTISADTSIKCGHILWSELIHSDNKADYTRYFEAQNGRPGREKESGDRGKQYLHEMKEAVQNAKIAS